MGNLFGIRRRAPVVTAQDRAVLQLKQQRDKITIYQKKTELELGKNKELALRLLQTGKQDRALVVMRRKKFMEETLSRLDKQLETLEQLVTDIEYTQIEVSVVEGLKVGGEALRQLNNVMNIDDIQQMIEDNEEAAEKQREISDLLTRASVTRYDDDELLKELDSYIPKTASTLSTDPDKTRVRESEEEPVTNPVPEQNLIEVNSSSPTKAAVYEAEQNVPKHVSKESNMTVSDIVDQLPEIPKTLPDEPSPVTNETKLERTQESHRRQMEPAQ